MTIHFTVYKSAKVAVLMGGAFFGLGQAIAPEHVQFVGLLTGAVVAVVGAVAWIDNRIKDHIRLHNEADMVRHSIVLDKIADLKRRLGD